MGEESGTTRAPRRQRLRVIVVQGARAGKQRVLAVMAKQTVPLSDLRACWWSYQVLSSLSLRLSKVAVQKAEREGPVAL